MSEWMPIETAPRDGTPVLGYWKGWDHFHADMDVMRWNGGGWWNDDLRISATHWMPLPAPPKESA